MTQIKKLEKWVELKHSGQLIKRSGAPYFHHLVAVANMAAPVTRSGYEVGLCHDLLEKTNTTPAELYHALIDFGYQKADAEYILNTVVELTDVYSKIAYPAFSKPKRKKKEEERLVFLSAGAQSVKYADLIYNINWIIKYDLKHIKKYLERKQGLLLLMNSGDPKLYHDLSQLIIDTLKSLEN